MIISANRRNPFSIDYLPLLGRLHRNSFRSGSSDSSPSGRLLSRLLFYPMKALSFRPVRGTMKVKVLGQDRRAHFDARNRQFSALYFDVFSCGYEPEFTTLIDALVPDDGILYDLGSNWGFFGIHLAARPGFNGSVHCFEPWPPTYSDLSGLVEKLELGELISCHELALSDVTGDACMHAPSHSGLAHVSGDQSGRKVRITTLDALDLPTPDLLKIDAEGLEEKIIQGGSEFLRENHPMLLFENRPGKFGEEECLAVLYMLEELGYRLFAPNLNPPQGERFRVELIPLTAKTRNQHAQHPNLFACHSTELERIEKAAG